MIQNKIKMGSPEEKALMARSRWNNGSFANVQRGDYNINGKTIYFRSKWEANYALYLDWLKKQGMIKDWKFEAKTFVFDKVEFGTRRYIPDFQVFTNKGEIEYHEVKGFMQKKDKTKIRRMEKYYPEVKLLLIDKDFYNDIKKKLGKMLKFY